jgi:hypothetical protein
MIAALLPNLKSTDTAKYLKTTTVVLFTLIATGIECGSDSHSSFMECIHLETTPVRFLYYAALGIFLNTLLFLGAIHQEVYVPTFTQHQQNGQMQAKLSEFDFQRFNFPEFKKLVIVLACT